MGSAATITVGEQCVKRQKKPEKFRKKKKVVQNFAYISAYKNSRVQKEADIARRTFRLLLPM